MQAHSQPGPASSRPAGSEDIAITPDKPQHIADGISGARLETVAGAGHMTPIKQPERVSQLISELLSGIDSASPK